MMLKQGRLPSHITKVSPPRYWKDRNTNQPIIKMWCIRNDYYKIRKNNTICISGKRHGRKPMALKYAGTIREGKRLRLEVCYDKLSNRWYAHVRVKAKNKKRNQPTKKFGSIDLGICNIATLYVPDKRPLIYSGRAVLSDWIYHTKTIAKLQSLLGQNQRSSIKIEKIFRTRKRRFKHAINAMLRHLFEYLKKMKMTNLIIGDLNGIRNDNNLGKHTNQKIHNFWSHNYIITRIKELGEECSIKIVEHSERGTSKTCCICGLQHNGRVHRGLYYCKEYNIVINADVSGAYNLHNVAVNGSLCPINGSSGSSQLAGPLMLRWQYHRWN